MNSDANDPIDPVLDELYRVRGKLFEQYGTDPQQWLAMLKEQESSYNGKTISGPVHSTPTDADPKFPKTTPGAPPVR